MAAGISGYGVSINKCYNLGDVTNTGSGASGACGICNKSISNNPPIKNSYNIGKIKCNSGSASGITSWYSAQIYNCLNSGSLMGKSGTNAAVARYSSCTK